MNKNLFLSQLRIQLRGLPEEEIEEVIYDYEGYFAEAKTSGISEEQAVENLGNPLEIAKDMKQGFKRPLENQDPVRNIVVIIGLVFFNLIFVLGLVLGAFGLFFGLFVTTVAFILSPILAFLSFTFFNAHLFELFLSFILAGIGLFIFPHLIKLAKYSYGLLHTYVQWNLRLMKGAS